MNYYDENAQEFFDKTVDADMSSHHEEFLKNLNESDCILDAGCGSGRDSKIFRELGYNVIAIDGSKRMCEIASQYTNINVQHKQFHEIDYVNVFDGIWACASLLHVPSDEMDLVLNKFKDSLKDKAILYASFKFGDFEGLRNGRFFNDFTENTATELFKKNDYKILKTWITKDSRPERDEKWVNILVKK